MNKNRYILKLKETDTSDSSKVELVNLVKFLSLYHVSIVDDSMFPKMILVETKGKLFDIIPQDFKNKWNIFPEKTYEVPDTRKFIRTRK